MNTQKTKMPARTLGIIGFGAFGQLAAQHLRAHFNVMVYDPADHLEAKARGLGVAFLPMTLVAQCETVIIAAPISCFEQVTRDLAKVCRPGALVIDVGSVKVRTAEIMERLLPDTVDVVATHPLFGPQSAVDGIAGLKIALCPLRGRRHTRLAAFLRQSLGLNVVVTTPAAHDREAATVQGLTHLIAKVLHRMGPLPSRMTTKSFDLLTQAVSMVQSDAPEVFDAIEKENPYSREVREQFFALAQDLSLELDRPEREEAHPAVIEPRFLPAA